MDKKIVPFKAEHLQHLNGSVLGLMATWGITELVALEQSGPAYTAMIDGDVVGCAGVILSWRGCGEVWSVLADEAKLYPLFLHRSVKRMLNMIIEEHELHRVQGIVINGVEKGHAWMRRLGFKSEGLMKNYTPDKDSAWRYARCK